MRLNRTSIYRVAATTVVLLASACSAASTPSVALPIEIDNQGGSLEGHTPRGFAGSGTGLFAGDNLNAGFPNGEGIQIWLTFELPDPTPTPARVLLTSDVLTTSGMPFADLGTIRAEPVTYESFGPELFDLDADGEASTCERVGSSGLTCDVTESVDAAIAAGQPRVQFRLLFESASDNDGEKDLALFFLTDSNTNEPGIFTLELS